MGSGSYIEGFYIRDIRGRISNKNNKIFIFFLQLIIEIFLILHDLILKFIVFLW